MLLIKRYERESYNLQYFDKIQLLEIMYYIHLIHYRDNIRNLGIIHINLNDYVRQVES